MPKWLTILLHVVVVAGGFAGSFYGHPEAGAAAGVANALLPSPLQK
jgi:hypothetical protein